MKTLKIFLLLSIILFLCTVFVNIYIYLNKNEGYAYSLSSYNSIYYPKESPAITKFDKTMTDSVVICISDISSDIDWEIRPVGSQSYIVNNEYPIVYLPINGNTYESNFTICRLDNGFCFDVNLQRQNIGDIQVITSSIPYINVSRYNFSEFCDISWISSSEREKIRKILNDILLIDTCKSTLSKVELITSHINSIANRDTNIGLNYYWNTYTACQIYEFALEGKTNLTCNEYSEVYYLFANEAGINTRRVGVVGLGNSDGVVKISGHHFNESYIPELGHWAFVDITAGKSYVLNSDKKVLNTFEILMANESGNIEGLMASSLSGDSIISLPYKDIRENEIYYFDQDCLIQYKFGDDRFDKVNQLNRYFFNPEPVLSLNYRNNKLFLKNIFLIISIVSALFIVGISVVVFLKRSEK